MLRGTLHLKLRYTGGMKFTEQDGDWYSTVAGKNDVH